MNRYHLSGAAALLVLAATTTAWAQQPELPQTPQPRPQQAHQQPAGNYAYPQPGQPLVPAAPLYRRSALGITLGWGAPYGWGFDYAHLVSPRIDVNAGFGLGTSGAKLGVGSRFYLAPEKKLSPYFGGNLVLSSATTNTLTVDSDYVEYTVEANALLHLRSGLRWQLGRVGLLGTLGYGLPLSGDPIVYSHNTPNPAALTRDVARALGPGGLELSLGMSIGLGR